MELGRSRQPKGPGASAIRERLRPHYTAPPRRPRRVPASGRRRRHPELCDPEHRRACRPDARRVGRFAAPSGWADQCRDRGAARDLAAHGGQPDRKLVPEARRELAARGRHQAALRASPGSADASSWTAMILRRARRRDSRPRCRATPGKTDYGMQWALCTIGVLQGRARAREDEIRRHPSLGVPRNP